MRKKKMELNDLTREELLSRAKELGITGSSRMSKEVLIAALKKALETDPVVEPPAANKKSSSPRKAVKTKPKAEAKAKTAKTVITSRKMELNDLTREELLSRAKELGITGSSRMSKEVLIAALKKALATARETEAAVAALKTASTVSKKKARVRSEAKPEVKTTKTAIPSVKKEAATAAPSLGPRKTTAESKVKASEKAQAKTPPVEPTVAARAEVIPIVKKKKTSLRPVKLIKSSDLPEEIRKPSATAKETPAVVPPFPEEWEFPRTEAVKAWETSPHTHEKSKSAFWDEPDEDLPHAYGEPTLVLMPRDPHCLYCYWEAPQESIDAALSDFAGDRDYVLSLRIYDLPPWHSYQQQESKVSEIEVRDKIGNWYVHVDRPEHCYVAELGVKLLKNGRFLVLLRSNITATPPKDLSPLIDDVWADIRHFDPAAFTRGIPSAPWEMDLSAYMAWMLKKLGVVSSSFY